MPFAPKIRKQLLKALEEAIIPVLKSRSVRHVYVDPIRGFKGLEHWTEREELLPQREYDPLQMIANWPEEYLFSFSKPTLSFIYEGVAFGYVGATSADVERQSLTTYSQPIVGITKLAWGAPCSVCYPAYIARSSGTAPVRNTAKAKVISIKLIGELIQVSHFCLGVADNDANHNLAINDRTLVQLSQIYQQELIEMEDETIPQAILLAFMARLQKYLLKTTPIVSNSSWVTPHHEMNFDTVSPKKLRIFHEASSYVQTHLNASLSVGKVAAHCGVSSSHINRIFKQVYGDSLMRFVTALRIATAQDILVKTPERVGDIAKLVGFSSTASFSTVFQKRVGISPSEYRYQERLKTKSPYI